MITSLRESKAKLSELVELANNGQDVLITVHGKIKAKLTAASDTEETDMQQWSDELKALQNQYATTQESATIEALLEESREDRL